MLLWDRVALGEFFFNDDDDDIGGSDGDDDNSETLAYCTDPPL